jgi:endonuclease-3
VTRETKQQRRERTARIADLLGEDYPEATTALNHTSAFELLVATILAAQCTDARVNVIAPDLFRRWPDARAMSRATQAQLERAVHSTGFYRNKAKNLLATSRLLVERHGGEVPQTMAELTALPGVARKTANVVLGTFFRRPEGVVVDTHCQRLSRRLRLTTHDDPVKIERDIMDLLPRERWTDFSHRLVFHGRRVCAARKPRCGTCRLREHCPSRQDLVEPRRLPGKYRRPAKARRRPA